MDDKKKDTYSLDEDLSKVVRIFCYLTLIGYGYIVIGGGIALTYFFIAKTVFGIETPLAGITLQWYTNFMHTVTIICLVFYGLHKGESFANIINALRGKGKADAE